MLFYAETQAKFDLIAVGVGFVIMGVIGYIVKLGSSRISSRSSLIDGCATVHIPVNNILVGGS